MRKRLKQMRFLVAITAALLFLNSGFSYVAFAEEVPRGPKEEVTKVLDKEIPKELKELIERVPAVLNLYFVRHAETVANATGDYSAANQKKFTEKGKKQLVGLTWMLNRYFKPDFIIVSPKVRALNTILPYLKENNTTAEIWPEIEECCYQSNRDVKPKAKFQKGKKITLSSEMKEYFRFRKPGISYFYKEGNYADGLLRIRKACDLLKERFGQSQKTVLIVGHHMAGAAMIEVLLGKEPKGHLYLSNAHLTRVEQKADGTFEIAEYDIPPPPIGQKQDKKGK